MMLYTEIKRAGGTSKHLQAPEGVRMSQHKPVQRPMTPKCNLHHPPTRGGLKWCHSRGPLQMPHEKKHLLPKHCFLESSFLASGVTKRLSVDSALPWDRKSVLTWISHRWLEGKRPGIGIAKVRECGRAWREGGG